MEYLFTFFEGIASFISPCLLPLLPIYISYFAGSNENDSRKKVVNAVGFVLGFTMIFILLSVFASSFGRMIGVNSKYIKTIFGIIIILLGLNYVGVFRITFLNKTKLIMNNNKDLNFIKSILFGIGFSISWTPCIGAFLSSALLLISQQQDILKGIVLIIIYSIGLGVPFIVSVVLIDKLKNAFDIMKNNYNVITIFSGIILIIMGFYIIFS